LPGVSGHAKSEEVSRGVVGARDAAGAGVWAAANEGRRKDVLSSEEREEIKKLRRENFELRRANEILKAAGVFFVGELDPHRPK
jgi:transposase-like protein